MAIIPPGMFLSQPPTTSTPSIHWPPTQVSMQSAMTSRETRLYFMPSVPIAMPSEMVGVPKIWALPPASSMPCDRGVGELLQARVARRDRRVAVGDADHRLLEVAFLVAEGVVHRPVRRAGDALGDVAGSTVDRHGRVILSEARTSS